MQARFLQEQLANTSEQGKELFELAVKVAQETTQAMAAIGQSLRVTPRAQANGAHAPLPFDLRLS